jgi:hypothetical protein
MSTFFHCLNVINLLFDNSKQKLSHSQQNHQKTFLRAASSSPLLRIQSWPFHLTMICLQMPITTPPLWCNTQLTFRPLHTGKVCNYCQIYNIYKTLSKSTRPPPATITWKYNIKNRFKIIKHKYECISLFEIKHTLDLCFASLWSVNVKQQHCEYLRQNNISQIKNAKPRNVPVP